MLAQQPFDLDPTFRATFNDWYVSSIYPQPDGKVIISGQVSFPGAEPFEYAGLARLNANGSWDPSFAHSQLGRGKITPWSDRMYVMGNLAPRRIMLDGSNDLTFVMGAFQIPYFLPLQGGDYHVYPDGRILMSGVHQLNYPAGGYVGFYNLIWFTNTGYLDTTKVHRSGDGVIYRFKELPDGKFICSGPMSQFDGHATSNIFRVHADGALDTSFYTGTNWGKAGAYLPLPDGRCYVAGTHHRADTPDTLQVVRLMPNGSLDPTFNNTLRFGISSPLTNPWNIGFIESIQSLDAGRLIVTGFFRDVDGEPRNSICVIDTSGQLLEDHFVDEGCGTYTYQGFTDASIVGLRMMADSMCYIWGSYHGYDDGTTSDPDQRFVTRLYGPDFSTGLREPATATIAGLYPNPTSSTATLQLETLPRSATLVVRDAMGRELQRRRISDHYTTLDLHATGSGVYTVEVWDTNGRVATERLVVE